MKSSEQNTAITTEITGRFYRRLYRSDSGDYCICVYNIGTGRSPSYATLVGHDLPEADFPVTFSGQWVNHASYGRQFQVEMVLSALPQKGQDIVKFVASMKTGIGMKRAQQMLNKAGIEKFWDVLNNQPECFLNIPGVTADSLTQLQTKIRGMTEQRDLYKLFAGDLSLTGRQYKRIRAVFRDSTTDLVAMIRENPFVLLQAGYTFEELDIYASKHTTFSANDVRRLTAAATQILLDAQEQSHVGFPSKEMAPAIRRLLSPCGAVSQDECRRFLDTLAMDPNVVLSDGLWYLKRAFDEEAFIAAKVSAMTLLPASSISSTTFAAFMDEYAREKGFSLSPDQMQAVWTALTRCVCVITGGPGTGKSTILDAILYCWAKFYRQNDWLLMAPTGKAAVRMAETTGQSAATIHSTLQLGVSESRLAPMETEVQEIEKSLIVLDECSMIDQSVAASLLMSLKGSPTGRQHLVLVGDPEQLPSVGYGNILADLIASQVVPVCRLNTIYRQAAGNPIITNAAKMREGAIDLDWTNKDFRRYHVGSDAENLDVAVRFYLRCVKQFGVANVAMLSPYHTKGSLCTDVLNKRLQEALNPDRGQPHVKIGRTVFRLNDRVMQLRNIPSGISNGDVGEIVKIDTTASEEETCLEVLFESGTQQAYTRDDLIQLTLAYSISVHKSQGSQYDCVILVLPNEPSAFLRRSIVYTAITRAKKYLAIISPTSTISYAIRNDKHDLRYTALQQRLQAAKMQVVQRQAHIA